jgi:hypothetical protein
VSPNAVLPEGWVERIYRLRVGVEVLDALGSPPPLAGIQLHLEQVPRPHAVERDRLGFALDGIGLPAVHRTLSGRFAVLFGDGRTTPLAVRIVSSDRRYVPRRLHIPAPLEADVVAEEHAHGIPPFPPRTDLRRRPVLFPGAAYATQAGATVVRGRVVQADGTPVRWTRVVARPEADDLPVLGRARGDDRGEFVLVLASTNAQLGAPLSLDTTVRVVVTARPHPAVDTPAASTDDPLWDCPIEDLEAAGAPDPVADGTDDDPAAFTSSIERVLVCRRGRFTHPVEQFVLP